MAGVTVAFDTLKAATRLREEAGFDETKARVLVSTFAEGMVENLATKEELAALRGEMHEMGAGFRDEMHQMGANRAGEVGTNLRAETRQVDLSLSGEMKQIEDNVLGALRKFEQRLTVRLGGAIAAAVAILVAVDKLL